MLAVPLLGLMVATGLLTGLDNGLAPTARAMSSMSLEDFMLYEQAAATCPGLPWPVLAAIGTVESSNGTSTAPGVASGTNVAGAEGPMQFEPATFNEYALPVPPDGQDPPSPYDPVDAAYAAARDLCANGARNAADLPAALYSYNHSNAYVQQVLALAAQLAVPETDSEEVVDRNRSINHSQAYVQQVLAWANLYANTYNANAPTASTTSGAGSSAAQAAVAYALAQLGTPYLWGGEGAGGFDCSGLVQAAYAAAGVSLPRVAQAQYDATAANAISLDQVQPGDLVFFGASLAAITHVGVVVSPGEMVDAPHTGADVRIESYSWPDLLAATRPTQVQP